MSKNSHDKNYFLRTFKNKAFDKNRLKVELKRINIIKKYIDSFSGQNMLDVGCGLGFFLKACNSFKLNCFGVDISSYAINKAESNTRAKLSQVNLLKQKFPFIPLRRYLFLNWLNQRLFDIFEMYVKEMVIIMKKI